MSRKSNRLVGFSALALACAGVAHFTSPQLFWAAILSAAPKQRKLHQLPHARLRIGRAVHRVLVVDHSSDVHHRAIAACTRKRACIALSSGRTEVSSRIQDSIVEHCTPRSNSWSMQATLTNAEPENVADRVELHTADMTALPLSDESVDVVVSSLAIHNIPTPAGRRRALDEGVRVLRPGSRLAIADLWETRQHAARLRELGWRNVKRRNLGWRMWYGGPWFPTRLVTATKPA